MNIEVNKEPQFENDSYLITIKNFSLDLNKKFDGYTELKRSKFRNMDVSKDGLEPFLEDRGSLRMFDSIDSLVGSIYTYAIQERHDITYQHAINLIKAILEKNPDSRRAVLRMANDIIDYKAAEFSGYDVSCLNLIHYLKNQVNLVFRSSDIQYELYTDIITLYEFFIEPIYGSKPIDIQIYGSTGQRIEYLHTLIEKIKEL